MKKIIISTMLLLVGFMSAAANDIVSLKFNRTGTDAASVAVSVVDGENNAIKGASASLTSVSHDLKGTAGNITSSIVCPNANANTSPTITMTFTVTGLPEGFVFNKLGLHIHALNGQNGYQETGDGKVRQWNVSAAAGENTFASFSDIDIAAGISGANKLWETNQFNSVGLDANGNLVLTLTITKGTENGGCFFGLSEVRLVAPLVHEFSADKVYYIQWKNTGANYITENRDKSLAVADKKNSNFQFWKLIPTDKSHCYKVQNVVTGNYLGSCNLTPSSSSRVNTSADAVEYYIGATAGGGNIAGCHYFSSTDCDDYSDETAAPRALNKDGASSYIITWTAGLQDGSTTSYKEGSYWKIVETTDEYQRPAPPAHADASKALTVYFRPCGMVSNTYLAAATIGGVDPIAYTAAAEPGSFYVPFSKDRGAVVRGSDFNVSITLSSADDADLKANAYFDWNADGDFEVTEPITLNGTAGTATVTVPDDAVSGDTRMRIRLNSNGLDYADDDVEGFVYDFPFAVVDGERKVFVDVNGANNGTVTLSATAETYAVGTQLTATATPKGNATFDSWREGGVVVSTDAEYTFTVENRNMTLKAYFTPNTAISAQWDFTFDRTKDSDTEASVTVTHDDEEVKGVTATIAMSTNYKTDGKLASERTDLLCSTTNSSAATEAEPITYTLTITNTTEETFAFDYIEVSDVALNGSGNYQGLDVERVRNFKVTYGRTGSTTTTTIGPEERYICDNSHCNGKEYPQGFGAKVLVPAGGTYTIVLDIYGINHDTGQDQIGSGCFYGLSKIALGAVPHYAVTVEGTEEAEAGVVYGDNTYNDGSTLNATLSLTANELAAAPVEGYLGSVALDKALGTILVTYQPCITTQWDITFTRTSTTAATASVTRGGEAVEGVTATIAMSTNYKTDGKLASERNDLLCSTTNSANATEAEPIKYTLTITNNTDKICLFDYIEVSDVTLDGNGKYQGNTVTRVRNFKVTYGGTTIGPEEREICNPAHSEGKEYPQGFGAKVSIPAKGTYTIVLEIYKIDHNNTVTNDIGTGCFYGLSKIALGNTAVSFGTTGYATLYAPIALTIPEGVTAYTGALEENNTWLTLTPIEGNTIPKEHAVILEGTAGNKLTLEAATEAGTTVSNNALKGQTSTIATPTSGTVYTLQSYDENEDGTSESVIFRKYLGDKVNGGRAYLVIPEQTAAQAVRVRKFNTPTEIENVETTDNGQQTTVIYDLQGRRVLNPTKGMYIVNGKKVIVK